MENFYEIETPQNKCCHVGFSLNSDFKCVATVSNAKYDLCNNENQGIHEMAFRCPNNASSIIFSQEFHTTSFSCVETMTNGSEIFASCSSNWNDTKRTGVGLGTVIMWGAQTYMTTNIAHVILCIIVVVVYCSVPELGRNIYNRAVLRHYISLMTLGCILTLLGCCDLFECRIDNVTLSALWLLLQYFTLSTVFWLNVICFDITWVITRFRWSPTLQQLSDREENRRLFIYGLVTWGGALIPTGMAAIFEFLPHVPRDFILKPNYPEYRKGPKPVVNLYFFLVPAVTLFFNNVLFVWTSCKIIKIIRSTEIATRNQSNLMTNNYFLFVKLYLLMGSPWFFGSVLACMNNLIILKVCRVAQPVLWLLSLLGDRKFRQKVSRKICLTRNTV